MSTIADIAFIVNLTIVQLLSLPLVNKVARIFGLDRRPGVTAPNRSDLQ